METVTTSQCLPTKTQLAETKINQAAKGFVGTFFTQMVEEMFHEVAESSEESGFETEMYTGFLAQGMGEKIAESSSSKHMVLQVENMMRRQAGLEEKTNGAQGHKVYAHITQQTKIGEATCSHPNC